MSTALPPPSDAADDEGHWPAEFRGHFDHLIAPIEGWLSEPEAWLLYQLARRNRAGVVVEIGAYRGRSTAALALGSADGARHAVYSVDPHAEYVGAMGGRYGPEDRAAFYRNALAAGSWRLVRLVGLRSVAAARAIDGPVGLLWIDGDHSFRGVMSDVRAWTPKLAATGCLVLDDVAGPADGPRLAVERLLREGWRLEGEVGKVAVLRPPLAHVEGRDVAVSAVAGIVQRNASELVTSSRLDLGVKCLYARAWASGKGLDWARRLYLAHVQLWNGFFERAPAKRGAEDFTRAFDELLQATAESGPEGIDTAIPITLDGSLLNGAHRLAAAWQFDRPVRAVQVEVYPDHARYDGAYFEALQRERGDMGVPGLTSLMALEFARVAPSCRVVTLFAATIPRRAEVDALLAAHGRIAWSFERDVPPSEQAGFIRLLYEGEAWVGGPHDGHAGARHKAQACFAAGSAVRLLLVEPHPSGDWLALKAAIRALFDAGNHSVHINDTTEEALRILRTAPDREALALYARSRPRPMPGFDAQFAAFAAAVHAEGRADSVVVTGSAVLALFGLRDSADLDHLHDGDPVTVSGRDDIGSHNAYAGWLPQPPAALVHEPWHTVVVDGIRFLRPAVLRAFKAARGEPKDLADVALIDGLILPTPLESLPAPPAPEPADPWRERPVLWLLGGEPRQLSWLGAVLADAQSVVSSLVVLAGRSAAAVALPGFDVPFLPRSAGDANVRAWADRIQVNPRSRVLVISDGLAESSPELQLAGILPKEQALVLRWASVDGWRESFLRGLAGFCWEPLGEDRLRSTLDRWHQIEPASQPA